MASFEALGEMLTRVFGAPAYDLPPSFTELLDRLQSDDARASPTPGGLSDAAFRAELERVLPELRRFARSLTRGHEAADDLMQDTMVKAWSARDRFLAGTNMRAWTFTILRNLFLSERRRDRFRGEWDEVAHPKKLTTLPIQEHALHMSDLSEALEQISPAQREALMLVGAGGMSYEEAADVMGVAIGTVKSRVSRGREALLTIMEGSRKPVTQVTYVGRSQPGSSAASL